MKNLAFVERFHELVLERIVDKKHWVKELAGILHLSEDAIYKKARFETSYSLTEFLILCEKYHISYNEINHSTEHDFIKFTTPFINRKIKTPLDYLKTLENNLLQLKTLNNPYILYTTRELPIFYYCLNHDFLAFKLYVFSKTVWGIPLFVENPFSMDLFDPEIFVLADKIWTMYSELHTEEYWTSNILDSTLQQLQFFGNCGQINKSSSEQLISSIVKVMDHCNKMAGVGSKCLKTENTNFQLYENKILHTSNQIMVNTKEKDFMFITFDNPNYIYTEDIELMQYSKQWYEKIKQHSYSLGVGTGHQRFQYFDAINNKIKELS
ncbi:MAG: hypothetical protein ABI851_08400 [Saprospiraceae bacterium]